MHIPKIDAYMGPLKSINKSELFNRTCPLSKKKHKLKFKYYNDIQFTIQAALYFYEVIVIH